MDAALLVMGAELRSCGENHNLKGGFSVPSLEGPTPYWPPDDSPSPYLRISWTAILPDIEIKKRAPKSPLLIPENAPPVIQPTFFPPKVDRPDHAFFSKSDHSESLSPQFFLKK